MKYTTRTRILVCVIAVSKSQKFLLKVRRLFIFFFRLRHKGFDFDDKSMFFWRRRTLVTSEVRYIQIRLRTAHQIQYVQDMTKSSCIRSPCTVGDLEYLQSILFTGHQTVYTTAYPHSGSERLLAKGRRLLVTRITRFTDVSRTITFPDKTTPFLGR